jgi:hypothetical protein
MKMNEQQIFEQHKENVLQIIEQAFGEDIRYPNECKVNAMLEALADEHSRHSVALRRAATDHLRSITS